MHTSLKRLTALVLASATLSACAVVPIVEEPVAQVPVVVVPPAPVCYEVAALQRVVVPAETKTIVGVSVIENPPYDPIEQRTEQKIVIKQAEVFYALIDPVSGNQTEVTNLCDRNAVVGPVGPAPGELIGAPT